MLRGVLAVVGLVAVATAGLAAEGRDTARGLAPLVRVLAAADDVAVQRDVLRGMCEALQGRRAVAAPEGWAAAYRKLASSPNREVREKALVLGLLFGDPQALAALRRTVADTRADAAARRAALQALVEKRVPDVPELLRDLLAEPAMRGPALRALAAYDDSGTPALVLRHYAGLSEAEKADAVATLASRPAYALALLDAMERGQVPRRDLSPFVARQLLNFHDQRLGERLTKVWGAIRPPSKEKAALLARYKGLATPAALKKADRKHGRAVFARTCATCHTLFNEGANIGPDLTGSQRANPEYVLAKVLDPNAVVPHDYQVTFVTTTSGRVVAGIVKAETDKVLTLQTQNEVVRLPKSAVEERRRSSLSMMPEGLLAQLKDAEVRDLLAYLAGPGQVALPTPP
jgi:putative heme-binding domain-containing protein